MVASSSTMSVFAIRPTVTAMGKAFCFRESFCRK